MDQLVSRFKKVVQVCFQVQKFSSEAVDAMSLKSVDPYPILVSFARLRWWGSCDPFFCPALLHVNMVDDLVRLLVDPSSA